MEKITYVGLDVHKDSISIAIAESNNNEVLFIGAVPNENEAVKKKVSQLYKKFGKLFFVYEAGPCGYGLYRLIRSLGHICEIVAPATIPGITNNRKKNDHRDAKNLARLSRIKELRYIWVPDEVHEAIRELVRARHVARKDIKRAKQRIKSFLLKRGESYEGKSWSVRHRIWLRDRSFNHVGLSITFQNYLNGLERIESSIEHIEQQLQELSKVWELNDHVVALQALKGVGFTIAVSFISEVGDPSRFPHPKNLMAFLGLIPGERSSGERKRSTGITKTGNVHIRSLIFESAWNYTKTPKVGNYMKKHLPDNLPDFTKDISWKAQVRLNRKYKKMIAKGKVSQKAIAAVARELVGFMWAICNQLNHIK